MSQVSKKVNQWMILLEFVSKYDLNGIIRDNAANNQKLVFSPEYGVRVGSVIFLVGVGSIVCWRLWNYWNDADDEPKDGNEPPKTPTPPKIPSKKGKRTFFANLLDEEFVQDIKDFEGDDPALIQGRYFGPETTVECGTPSYSDCSPASNASSRINTTNPSSQLYHADNSGSIDERICHGTSESEVEDLPLDEDSAKCNGYSQRRAKKKFKSTAIVKSSSSSSSVSPHIIPPGAAYKGRCSEAVPERVDYNNRPTLERPADSSQNLDSTNMQLSINNSPLKIRPASLQVQNTTGRSRMEKTLREEVMKQKLKHYFANYDSDDDWISNDEEEPLTEDKIKNQPRRLSREQSLSNIMEKMRQRGPWRRGSLEPRKVQFSRDNSVPANLSEFVLSPTTHPRLRRDDSIASNMSDYAASECSEFSIDFSIKDDSFANNTLSYLVDIENELDFVKSSVFEIDEEFFRYASRPNPYLLKTTFTENSYESNSSRPGSSLMEDLSFGNRIRRDSEASVDFFEKIKPRNSSSNSTAENSLEWDSPQHGWSSVKNSKSKRHHRSASAGGLPRSQSQEIQPSLEWDDGYFKKYEDEIERVGSKSRLDWQLFLPDHASLELDMEEELKNPSASYANFSALNLLELQQSKQTELENRFGAPAVGPPSILMTASIDSAIYSTSGSRSGSMSPASQMLSQSMMSSGLGASLSELSPEREFGQNSDYILSKRRRSFNPDIGSTLAPVKETGETPEITEPPAKNKSFEFYLPDDSESEDDGRTLENFANNNIMGNKFSSKSSNQPQPSKITRFEAVGRRIDIIKYAKCEWTGNTQNALTILKGYEEIPKQLNFYHIRKIRGDNYCGIRSVLFQMLSTSVPVPNCQHAYTKLMSNINKGNSWIRKYSFANRLPYSEDNISNGFSDCLGALDKMVLALSSVENKETVLLNRLNSDPNLDAKLCEAAKLMILHSSIEIYNRESNNESDVALLSTILFARETSSNPQAFLINHLNCVGNTAGLEQIEMFLLGHALRVTIAVVRPSCFGKTDYICFFPDSHMEDWPKVYLVAEDDRHYNILSS